MICEKSRHHFIPEDRFSFRKGETAAADDLRDGTVVIRSKLGIEEYIRTRSPNWQAARNLRFGKVHASHARQSPVKIRSTNSPTLGV